MDRYLSFGHLGAKETPAPARRNKYKPEFKAKVAIEACKYLLGSPEANWQSWYRHFVGVVPAG